MSVLHLIRTSNFATNDLSLCLNHLSADDSLILLDDGCYNLHHPLLNSAVEKITRSNIYMLGQHASARGLKLDQDIELISMAEVVQLVLSNQTVITWQ